MILVVSDLWVPFPGGAERLIFNLARELYRAGESVDVITGYERAQRFDGPPVGFHSIESGAQLADLIAEHGPKVQAILTHHYWATLYEKEIMAAGAPVVQIVLNGRRLPGAAFAVFISEWVRAQLADEPTDLTMVPPAFADVVAEDHGDAIGFVKPLVHKGVELVYEIAAAMPDRQFVILRGEWQNLELIEPAPNITFLEPVDDIADFYARCRLVLMPSLSEDAGTVAQECALNLIPCISSDVGGLPETNAGGLRLHVHHVGVWTDAIERFDDPTFYNRIVTRQRRQTPTYQPELMQLFIDRVRSLR